MQIIKYPLQNEWAQLIKRPLSEKLDMADLVKTIFDDVIKSGDKALIKYTNSFDKVNLKSIQVTQLAIDNAASQLLPELKNAIEVAKNNITQFHKAQLPTIEKIETTKGVICWREYRPIQKVGIYIPGGTAPLFSSLLMLGIPATLAGCTEIIICTPPDANGQINPAILYTAAILGITKIYTVGGIQAIAAMTFGTATIPKVFKIFGPGNQYVTAAKQLAQNYGLAIDMPAGPSEVLIIADESSNPIFVAADLLSQAEHGVDSQTILLSNSEKVINNTVEQLNLQLNHLPRKDIATIAISHSKAILLQSIDECIALSNDYAPEHLILALENTINWLPLIANAGSVFLGNYSCEAAGDYATGTNHTLPTNGFAKNYSGVSIDSFVKKITVQKVSEQGLINIAPTVIAMADTEGLWAHKNAVSVRLNKP